MVFKIPISKSQSLLNKVNLLNDGDDDMKSLRDELQKRSDIKMQLWIQGN